MLNRNLVHIGRRSFLIAVLFLLTYSDFCSGEILTNATSYFSNFRRPGTDHSYEFNAGWYIDFTRTVEVTLVFDGPGTFELIGHGLADSTLVALDHDTSTFFSTGNRCPYYKGEAVCVLIYVPDYLFGSGSERFTLTVSPQGNNNLGKAIFTTLHYDDPPPMTVLALDALNSTFRGLVEGSRLRLLGDSYAVDQLTRSSIVQIQAFQTLGGIVLSGIQLKETVAGSGKVVVEWVDDVPLGYLSGAMDELAVLTVGYESHQASGSEKFGEFAQEIADAAAAGLQLYHGNPIPAYWYIANSFTKVGVYAGGIWSLHGVEERVDASLIAERLVDSQVREGTLFDSWSDESLLEIATSELVPQLESEGECGFLKDAFDFLCSFDDFNRDEFLAAYRGFSYLIRQRAEVIAAGNNFDDADLDGWSNAFEVDSGLYDPNDPSSSPHDVSPVSVANARPVAVIEAVGTSFSLGDSVRLDGRGSYDRDSDDRIVGWTWRIHTPEGMVIEESQSFEFTALEAGSYTAQLTVEDGEGESDSETVTFTVTESYPDVEVVYEDDALKIYVSDLSVGECTLKPIGTFDVPAGERWRNVKFAASQGDVVLLVDDDEMPSVETSSTRPCPEVVQDFDSDREFDFAARGAFFNWSGNWYPGSTIRIAAFSYEGESNFSINTEVTVNYDLDLDGVPDFEEDAVCLDNHVDAFDSDDDGVCDSADSFPTDRAASIDSDGDDYPDSWNTGRDRSDSTTGLSLDAFADDESEWRDTDSDGVGDNTDTDDDGDGIPDEVELSAGLDPLDRTDATADADADEFDNRTEHQNGTDINHSGSFPARPAMGEIANVVLTEGDSFVSDTLNVDAPWAIPLSFTLLSGPQGASTDATSGIVTWPMALSDDSPYLVRIRAANLFGVDEREFSLTVEIDPIDTDSDGVRNFVDDDDDGDGLPDHVEDSYKLDPLNFNDAAEDLDRDGLTNLDEYLLGTKLQSPDTDGDGLRDGFEVDKGLSPLTNEGAALVPAATLLLGQ